MKRDKLIDLKSQTIQYQKKLVVEAVKFTKKYDSFYNKLDKEKLKILNDYKYYLYEELNIFLFNREFFLKDYTISLFDITSDIFNNKKLSKDEFEKKLYNYILNKFKSLINFVTIFDSIFKISPKLKGHITVYRGITIENNKSTLISELKDLKCSNTIHFPNYLSTSLMEFIARDFLIRNKGDNFEHYLFKIRIPKNFRVLYLDTFKINLNIKFKKNKEENKKFYPEYEVLLPRSCVLKYKNNYEVPMNIPYYFNKNILNKIDNDIINVYEFELVEIKKDKEKIGLDNIKNVLKDWKKTYFKVSKRDLLGKNMFKKDFN